MADNGTAASGPTIAWDEIALIAYQRVKVTFGVDGVATDVSAGNPLPTNLGDGTSIAAIKAASVAATFADPALTVAVRPGGALVTSAAALADALANPTIGIQATTSLLYNGTTWDRARGTIANGMAVDVTRLPALVASAANIGKVTATQFDNSADVTMQTAAVAIGNGTVLTTTGYGTALVQITGTFVGTVTFEATEDGTNYVAVSAVQVGTSLMASTATAPGIYRLAPVGMTNVRARISAYTSGSITALGRTTNAPFGIKVVALSAGANVIGNVGLVAGAAAIGTVAINAALPTGTNTIGALTANQSVNSAQIAGVATSTGNGVTGAGSQRVTIASDNTPFTVNTTPTTPTASIISSAATTNATSIKATAGTLYSITVSNVGAAAAFVKLYNLAAAPTVGTSVPALTIPVAASGSVTIPFGAQGMRFGTGIALAITNLVADADTTVIAAAQVKVLTSYI